MVSYIVKKHNGFSKEKKQFFVNFYILVKKCAVSKLFFMSKYSSSSRKISGTCFLSALSAATSARRASSPPLPVTMISPSLSPACTGARVRCAQTISRRMLPASFF